MINDLLHVAAADSDQLAYNIIDVKITDVISEVFEGLRPVAKNLGRRLVSDIPDLDKHAALDPVRFGQALQNLISNAIKYSPEKSGVAVLAQESRSQLLVTVRNKGSLTKQESRDAFVRFKRLDNYLTQSTPSTGLGLPISREIIESMGGTVILESKQGVVEARLRVPIIPTAIS